MYLFTTKINEKKKMKNLQKYFKNNFNIFTLIPYYPRNEIIFKLSPFPRHLTRKIPETQNGE